MEKKIRREKTFLFFLPYLIISACVIYIFRDFFLHGYVFSGNNDIINNTVPFKLINLRAFQSGTIPQWNPYIFCGTSYLGSGVVQFFYPLELPLYFFPETLFPFLLTISMILHMLAAGFFSFLLFKDLFKDRYWATLASLTYLLSAVTVSLIKTGTRDFSTFTYLPIYLYFIRTIGNRKACANFLLLAFTPFLIISGGNLQLCLYALLFASAYSLFRSISASSGRSRIKHLALNFTALCTAVGMSALIIIPLIYNSKECGLGQSTYQEFMNYALVNPIDLIRVFAHKFVGRLASVAPEFLDGKTDIMNTWHIFYPFSKFESYSGTITAILAFCAMFLIRGKESLFWKAAVIFIILSITNTPLNRFFYAASGKTLTLFNHFSYLLPICFSALFGFAGIELNRSTSHRYTAKAPKQTDLKFFTLSIYTVIAVFLILGTFIFQVRGNGTDERIINILESSATYFILFSSLSLALIYLFQKNLWPVFSKTVLLAVLLADLTLAASFELNIDRLPVCSPPPLFKSEHTQAWKWAKEMFEANNRKVRFLIGEGNMPSSQSVSAGLYNSSGYASLSPRNMTLIYSYPKRPNRINSRSIIPASQRACALSGTRAIIKGQEVIPVSGRILLRTRLFTEYQVIPEDEKSLETLMSPSLDIFKTLILQTPPGIVIVPERITGSTEIIEDTPEHVGVNVQSDRNCLLLLTDTYANGWRALLDSKETPLIRADFAFRAVAVPAGRHKVDFIYRHPGLRISILITALAWTIFAIAAVFSLLKNRIKLFS